MRICSHFASGSQVTCPPSTYGQFNQEGCGIAGWDAGRKEGGSGPNADPLGATDSPGRSGGGGSNASANPSAILWLWPVWRSRPSGAKECSRGWSDPAVGVAELVEGVGIALLPRQGQRHPENMRDSPGTAPPPLRGGIPGRGIPTGCAGSQNAKGEPAPPVATPRRPFGAKEEKHSRPSGVGRF